MIDKTLIYRELGRIIQKERVKKEWTQEELGTAVGLSRTSITNLEKGRQGIPIHTLFEIADKLHVAPASLLPDIQKSASEEEALNVLLKKNAVSKKEEAFIKKALRS